MRWKIIGFLVATFMFAAPARAADRPEVGPVPAWVVPNGVPIAREAPGAAAIHVLLNDQQVWFHGDTTSIYSSSAVRIDKPEGLAALGTIALQWKPETGRVIIHALKIRHGNQVIDALGDGKKFEILRRENNLELAMIDGVLTAAITLEGLQVGDVVELSYTIERTEPLMRGHHDLVMDAGTEGGVDQLNIAALWDKRDVVRQRSQNLPAPLKQSAFGLSIAAAAVQPLTLPQGAPPRYLRGRQIELSDYRSWAEVADTFTGLYDDARKLGPNSPLLTEIATIKAASPDPTARAGLALALVENNIRYLYVGLSQSNLKPAAADTTWQRRFGDCKAKTVILLALLDGLGIAGEPALVSSAQGDGLDQRLPNAVQFDHVIVRATIGRKTYWLDATRIGDKDIAALRIPPFHWALPLHAGSDRLEPVVIPIEDKPTLTYDLRLDASKGIGVPADASAEMIMRGDTARATHLGLAAIPKAQLDAALRGVWTKQYDFITSTSVSEQWDEASGLERLTMRGSAKMEWNFDRSTPYYQLEGASVGWRGDYHREPGPDSNAPFAINYPDYAEFRETVILPPDSAAFSIDGDDVDRVIARRQIFRHTELKGNVLTMISHQKPLAPELAFAEGQAADADLRQLSKSTVFISVNPAIYEMTMAEAEAKLAEPPTGLEPDFMIRVRALALLRRYDEGLSQTEKYVAAFPGSAEALGFRSEFNSLTGHDDAARDDFARALALDPNRWIAHLMQSFYLYRDNNKQDPITNVLAFLLWSGAQECFKKSDYVCTLRKADRALSYEPDLSMLYVLRANAYQRLRQREKAMAEADRMIAMLPRNADVRAVAGVIYCSMDRCDKGLAAFSASITIKPNIIAYLNRVRYLPASEDAARRHDIDAALKLEPENASVLLALAEWQNDHKDAAGELATLEKITSQTGDDMASKIKLASMFAQAGQQDRARALFAEARGFASASHDGSMFNSLCYSATSVNFDLQVALSDCHQATVLSPNVSQFLDSMGFVELRLGQYADAIAAYDKALAIKPDEVHSLFGRGLARIRSGAAVTGEADIAAAGKLKPNIVGEFAKMGVVR